MNLSFSVYDLKPQFQQALRPLLASLVRRGVTPNQITVLAMALSLAYGVALALHPANRWLWGLFPVVMLLRMALNAVDGMLATATGQKTALGALLNEMGDQLSDVALYLPFALVAQVRAPMLVIVVAAALLAEFAGVLAVLIGAARRFDGPMGKSDRAVVFGLMALLVAGGARADWFDGLLMLTLALLVWTTVNRLRQALRAAARGAPRTP
ncbi:CDP-alcohol phosphatidyltransferase family protein [uncultured Sphaerotilus sp.]|uniref:CDP-alcohol phosphatidyltransferase family protein n=1 Tax=uncultured Sphaerotilus sp. TaxID=474984 RepID=UPI0030CA2F36